MPNTFIGQSCDEDGDPLDPALPPITERWEPIDWTPFSNRIEFETADFLYKRCQMSGSNITILMKLWAAYSALRDPKDTSSSNLSPFINQRRTLHSPIDSRSFHMESTVPCGFHVEYTLQAAQPNFCQNPHRFQVDSR